MASGLRNKESRRNWGRRADVAERAGRCEMAARDGGARTAIGGEVSRRP